MQQMLMIVLILGVAVSILIAFKANSRISATYISLLQMINANAQLEKELGKIELSVKEEIARNREETSSSSRQLREEISNAIKLFEQSVMTHMAEIAGLQKNQLDIFSNQLASLTQTNENKLENIRESVETKIGALTEETAKQSRGLIESISARMAEISTLQQNQLENFAKQISNLTQSNEQKMEQMRGTIELRIKTLQDQNTLKLDEIKILVGNELHDTLEKRLGESFKQVSERLELVHKGLGEMTTLATGVGDLKKILSNVKTRGTWGEVQLGNILEDLLTPDQYSANVAVKKGSERVEFAIKLPGPDQAGDGIWLPIDAKFPMEDYQRLVDAQELSDPVAAEQASKQLEIRIKGQSKDICSKYIEPPATTDFAIMFLPTEGLFAEVLRRPGLFESLRRDYNVIVAGPTTLSALINSLSMGFRTLAIQKQSSEVWAVLGAVKTEFGKFGAVLEKTQKKLQEASNTIDDASKRSRSMERKLKSVEALPEGEAIALLGGDNSGEIAAELED